MKKLLLALTFFVLTFSVNATTRYISPSGNNANSGTIGSPWLTLSYACTHTSSGDIIHVLPGTYTTSTQCVVPVGVSIEGEGVSSHIISTYTGGAVLLLSSNTDGTNGNQSISFIKLSGSSLTGHKAILVQSRSNVKIHDCTIQDFLEDGVLFKGAILGGQPTSYMTGCELYNCIISNNSDRSTGGQGNIVATGYRGLLIHDNIITQTSRALGHNGNTMSATTEGFSEGLKFYNNISYRNPNEGNEWSFHLELWDSQGGFEIYNNQFYGGSQMIDFGGSDTGTGVVAGSYTYAADVHHNLFQFDSPVTGFVYYQEVGINIEGDADKILIRNNHFKNVPYGVQLTLNHTPNGHSNITIRNNLFENGGYINDEWGFDVTILSETGTYVNGVQILNNTFVTNSLSALFIYMNAGATVKNIQFTNNIVKGVRTYGYLTFSQNAGTKDSFTVKNNLLYQNAGSNSYALLNSATLPSHWTYTGNFVANPLLTSVFHLPVESPAIDAGVNVGLSYAGLAPDCGAYEYGLDIVLPIKARFLLTNVNNSLFQWESLDEDGIAYWAIEESTDYGLTWNGFKNVAAYGSPYKYMVR